MQKVVVAVMLLLSLGLCRLTPAEIKGQDVDERKIAHAIARGVEFLKQNQKEDGSWDSRLGVNALALDALLYTGAVKEDDEVVKRALNYLLSHVECKQVYDTALLAIVLYDLNPSKYKETIAQCAAFLDDAQLPNGMWTYGKIDKKAWLDIRDRLHKQSQQEEQEARKNAGVPKAGAKKDKTDQTGKKEGKGEEALPGDNSNTQFALLGLRVARLANIKSSMDVVKRAQMHFVSTQNPDGGWAYHESTGASYGSMSCAGVASLLIAGEVFKSGTPKEIGEFRNKHIKNGLDWLSKNYNVNKVVGHFYYYLYSVERVGIFSGQKYFGDHNWYREGATRLIELQNAEGSWGIEEKEAEAAPDPSKKIRKPVNAGEKRSFGRIVDTSFALLFFGKGMIPTVFKQYRSPDNDLPENQNPLPTITDHMKNEGGHRMDWQPVESGHAQVKDMLESPALFISGAKELKLSDDEVSKLRQYINGGGMLVACAAASSSAFDRSFREAVTKMLPDAKLSKVPDEHPLYNGLYQIPNYARNLEIIETKTRPLVIYSPKDMFSGNPKSADGKKLNPNYQIAANIASFLLADPELLSRLKEFDEVKEDEKISDNAIKVGQLTLDPKAAPLHPCAILRLLAAAREKRDLKNLAVKNYLVTPDDPNLKSYKMLYLTGVEAPVFTEEQIEALSKYLKSGGTLFVDAALGKEEFDTAFRQLAVKLVPGGEITRIDTKHPLLKSAAMGGWDISNVQYRPEALTKNPDFKEPYLEVVNIKTRPAIIYSKYDLASGWEGFPTYQSLGLKSKSATMLGINVVIGVSGGVK